MALEGLLLSRCMIYDDVMCHGCMDGCKTFRLRDDSDDTNIMIDFENANWKVGFEVDFSIRLLLKNKTCWPRPWVSQIQRYAIEECTKRKQNKPSLALGYL